MISLCFYFQVHQPFRLRSNYNFFEIGTNHFYEDENMNREILNKVSEKCYLPANEMMLRLIDRHKGKFRFAFSISGVCIDQMEKYRPDVLESFKKLAETGCVEFIAETYYHSLSFLFSKDEFKEQVKLHQAKMKSLFNYEPTTFRNTELIYNNDLARYVGKLGFKTILSEGADQVLGWRSPNFLYRPFSDYKLNLLMKNYRLADDLAFRFSNKGWAEWPLTAEKYASWLHAYAGRGEIISLFMDYETFGEHQWADTGIFSFFSALPDEVFKDPSFDCIMPNEASKKYSPMGKIDVPYYISWADVERDLTAWLGNPLQDSAIKMAYEMEPLVKAADDPDLLNTWRKLLTSDHFYYMCTKWFSDGDVHKYFNPFPTPYDAYIIYINVLNDLALTLEERGIPMKKIRSRIKRSKAQ